MPDENQERGFTVVDRRGEEDAPAQPEASKQAEAPAQDKPKAVREMPAIDFSTFVLSLSTSALFHMGLVEDPETGKPAEPNLPIARQTIDTLEMLQEKTRGNLDEEEARLLTGLLYELRMRFVESRKG